MVHQPEQEAAPPDVWLKPPIASAIFIAAAAFIEDIVPLNEDYFVLEPQNILMGGLLMLVSVLIAVLALRELTRAGTSFMLGRKASRLVTTGIYKRSRNPIYLGFVLFTAGLGVLLASPWIVISAVGLFIYLQEHVVKREEAYLQARFGEEYKEYRLQAGRWF